MTRIVQTLIATAASVTLVAALAVAEGGDHSGGVDDRYVAAFWGRSTGTTTALKGDKAQVARLVVQEAQRQGVPHRVALAVAKIESGYTCNAIGPQTRHGRAHGPLQVLPSSAKRFGYHGPAHRLATCDEGLRIGMAHLADCYRRAGGDSVRVAACHVGGPGMASGPRGNYAKRYVRLFEAALARQGG